MESQNIDSQNSKIDISEKTSDLNVDNETLKTSNIIMWFVALFPVLLMPFDSFLERNFGEIIIFATSMIPVSLCIGDRQIWLNKKIKITNIFWIIFFYPIYIWKRANTLKKSKIHFWSWVAAMLFFLVWTFQPGEGQSVLESLACDTTTQIIKEQLNSSVKCNHVIILESEGKIHHAVAELSTGRNIDITITEARGGRIYVEIPEQ